MEWNRIINQFIEDVLSKTQYQVDGMWEKVALEPDPKGWRSFYCMATVEKEISVRGADIHVVYMIHSFINPSAPSSIHYSVFNAIIFEKA